MRICLVSQEVAPFLHGGGIATYTAEMARALADAGHDVHLLTSQKERLQERIPPSLSRVRFHEVVVDDGPPLAQGGYHTPVEKHSMGVYRALKHLHSRYSFDYIEFPDYNGEAYFSLRAKRTLGVFDDVLLSVRLHMTDMICRGIDGQPTANSELAVIWHMERSAIMEADMLTSPSAAMLDRTGEFLGEDMPDGADQPRFVIPNPLDSRETISQMSSAGGSAKTDDVPTILYFGRTQHVKGVHLIVDAGKRMLARGLNVRFRFIGADTPTGPNGGSMRKHLHERIGDAFRERFVFEDRRPRDELGQAIRDASLCCFPSIFESFSMACVEAMALGTPVVGSDSGGIGEIIEDGVNGLLARPDDSEDLARVLTRAINDDELRRNMGLEAPRRVVELCDPERVATRLSESVASVLERTSGATVGRPVPSRERRDGDPTVSVIIPFYNLGKYLPQTLDSLRQQTFTDYDLLIVDDGSTDPASLELLEMLKGEGVRILRKRNGGASSARNTGLREVAGDFVLTLDADDLILPTYLEDAYHVMRDDDGLAAVSCPIQMHNEPMTQPMGVWIPLGFDRDIMPFMNVGTTGTTLLRRSAILDAGGYDETFAGAEDWDLWCRLAEAGWRASIIPEFNIAYRVRYNGLFRTAVMPFEEHLKARILERHIALAPRPDFAARLELGHVWQLRRRVEYLQNQIKRLNGELTAANAPRNGDLTVIVNDRARELVEENIRYRVADRVNSALKAVKLQGTIKAITSKAIRSRDT